jgi:hypothetical protein
MSLSSYGRLATEVYDITKPIGHSFGDVEFYLERLKSCTGRVLIPLMEAGLEIEGTDNSPEMLTICRPYSLVLEPGCSKWAPVPG